MELSSELINHTITYPDIEIRIQIKSVRLFVVWAKQYCAITAAVINEMDSVSMENSNRYLMGFVCFLLFLLLLFYCIHANEVANIFAGLVKIKLNHSMHEF